MAGIFMCWLWFLRPHTLQCFRACKPLCRLLTQDWRFDIVPDNLTFQKSIHFFFFKDETIYKNLTLCCRYTLLCNLSLCMNFSYFLFMFFCLRYECLWWSLVRFYVFSSYATMYVSILMFGWIIVCRLRELHWRTYSMCLSVHLSLFLNLYCTVLSLSSVWYQVTCAMSTSPSVWYQYLTKTLNYNIYL